MGIGKDHVLQPADTARLSLIIKIFSRNIVGLSDIRSRLRYFYDHFRTSLLHGMRCNSFPFKSSAYFDRGPLKSNHVFQSPRHGKRRLHTQSSFSGGSGWIRTTEATRNRFTVCPLWPLGNAPRYNAAARSGVFGAGERSRTINLLITNQLLCH